MGTSGQAEEIVTRDDVVILNRAVVARAAVMARLVGSALIVLAAVAAAAWAWLVVRQQVTMDDASSFSGGGFEDLSIGQRVDLFANILPYLVYAGLALGAGIGLRLLADYAQARTGGSLTGYEPGDTLPDPDPERDDYAPPPVPAD
jgi:hypothetical protein